MRLTAAEKESPRDKEDFLALLQGYIADPMGEGDPLTKEQKETIWQDLGAMPQARLFFAEEEGLRVGYLLAFELYSTFLGGRSYNIHDFFIHRDYRGRGLGGQMMDRFKDWAVDRNACKITLEVREDNIPAQELYHSRGFGPSSPPMRFYGFKTPKKS